MRIHFIVTSNKKFNFGYYRAVVSALHTQTVDGATIIETEGLPDSKYIQYLQKNPRVKFEHYDLPESLLKYVPAIQKDYIQWNILYERGGIVADLDTMWLLDITGDLGDKDILVPMDISKMEDCEHPFNNAIIMAKPQSFIVGELIHECKKRLLNHLIPIKWGDTGPALLTKIIKENLSKVQIGEFRVYGGFGGHEILKFYDGTINVSPKTKVLHLFSQASGGRFDEISEWDIKKWLKERGRHYKPMFDYLQTHKVRNILEIGTFNGDNAVGMIKTSLAPQNEITYYGIDIFEKSNEKKTQDEVLKGYNSPPPIDVVKSNIVQNTGANVCLFKGDSTYTLPQCALPIMDFIYIDGGHSVDTIRKDWQNVQRLIGPDTAIFFDDYFIGRDDIGCKFLENEIDRSKFNCGVIGEVDDYGEFRDVLMLVHKHEPLDKEYYLRLTEEEGPFSKTLGEAVLNFINPTSVVDVGCGTGLYLKPFIERGGIYVKGMEINPIAVENSVISKDLIIKKDICNLGIFAFKGDTGGVGYDVAICLEVFEHINEVHIPKALLNLCGLSDLIIFSSAQPGQGGNGHVFLKPKSFWEEKFSELGYFKDYDLEIDIWNYVKKRRHMGWFRQNFQVFRYKE